MPENLREFAERPATPIAGNIYTIIIAIGSIGLGGGNRGRDGDANTRARTHLSTQSPAASDARLQLSYDR